MAKEKSTDKEERRREKHAKKEKRSEKDGIHKSKKIKKDKTVPATTTTTTASIAEAAAEEMDVTTTLLNTLEDEKPGSVAIKENGEVQVKVKTAPLVGALVPFANPLADEKVQKKVLKGVKKAAKNNSLKRGVKEVVKSLRKSGTAAAQPGGGQAPSVIVLAADISPMDVISHIPVLCEDHGIPYIFVPSRAELGAASNTKRPTSVVMVSEKGGKKKAGEKTEAEGEFLEVYKDLVKVIVKASRDVKI